MAAEKKAVLVLADGAVIYGDGMGAECTRCGELVFNTSMMGYQEALTDPSYAGQILLMTYPLIGNYGISKECAESKKVQVEGFCVKWAENTPHHYKSVMNLDKYLQKNKVGGIYNIDTRMVARKIRNFGVMMSACQVYKEGKEPDIEKLKKMISETVYSNLNFVPEVSTKKREVFGKGGKKVALIDYGVKGNIIRELNKRNVQVIVVPYNASAEEISKLAPDGILLSNGPGDPAILKNEVSEIKKLIGKYPIMGICLGHQLLASAAGAKTYKLKFGHRGSNHPVLDRQLNRVFITTQNHGFAVDANSLPKEWEITHVNLNDKSVEGISHRSLPIFSVQYHPEASPGPQDSGYLIDKFVKML